MTARQLGALALVAGVWGSSFLFVKVLLNAGLEPIGVATARMWLGVVTLVPFAIAWRHQFPRKPAPLIALGVLGVTNFALPWSLVAYGQREVPSGVGAIANAALPLWTAVFAAGLIPGERLGPQRVAGLLLGFAGVVALMADDAKGLQGSSVLGIGLLVSATVCYAASVVSIRRWLREVPALPLTVGQIVSGALVLLPISLATRAFSDADMGLKEWSSLAALGALGSGVVVVAFMWLLGQVGPVRTSVVTYLIPPIGVFLGWLLLDERLGLNMVFALLLIVAGIALVQGVRLTGRRLPRVAAPATVPGE